MSFRQPLSGPPALSEGTEYPTGDPEQDGKATLLMLFSLQGFRSSPADRKNQAMSVWGCFTSILHMLMYNIISII